MFSTAGLVANSKCSSISAQRWHRVCFVRDNIISLSCEYELVTDSSSALHVCARLQPYLRKNIGSQPKFSRIFTYRDNSAKLNISRNFFQPSVIY